MREESCTKKKKGKYIRLLFRISQGQKRCVRLG